MSTSSTARSSSSSGHVRSTAEPHLYIPAIKEFPALPKKPVKPPAPRLSLANERKVLRRLKKKAITKTVQGSIAKVRRRYPGTASLRDTSSEGSVSSRGSSSGSTEGRSKKILAGSGLEKGESDERASLADDKINLAGGRLEKGKSDERASLADDKINLVGNHENANSGAEVTKLVGNFDVCYPAVEKEYLVGRKVDPRDAQDDVSTLGIHFQNSHFLGFRLN